MALPGWDLASQRELAGGAVRPAILFRLNTSPVVRLWTGVGDLAIPADLIEDTDGAIYSGMGQLVDLPSLNALVNGLAERADFVLAGAAVTGEVAALASSDAQAIRGARVNLSFFVFGDDAQQLSPTAHIWEGTSDSLTVSADALDGASRSRRVSLSVGSLFTGRKKPAYAMWSDPDQRKRTADDAGCDRINQYSGGSTKAWPR